VRVLDYGQRLYIGEGSLGSYKSVDMSGSRELNDEAVIRVSAPGTVSKWRRECEGEEGKNHILPGKAEDKMSVRF
jgi:hypothetical protein